MLLYLLLNPEGYLEESEELVPIQEFRRINSSSSEHKHWTEHVNPDLKLAVKCYTRSQHSPTTYRNLAFILSHLAARFATE